jgi:hypothetical protein
MKKKEDYGLSKTGKSAVKAKLDRFRKDYQIPFTQGYFISRTQLANMLASLENNEMDGLLLNFGADEDAEGEITQFHIIAAEVRFDNNNDESPYKPGQYYISQNPPGNQPPVMPSPPIPPL